MSMPENESRDCEWRKAVRGISNGGCVEVATTATDVVVRDSTDPDGVILRISRYSWRAFVAGVKDRLFDEPNW